MDCPDGAVVATPFMDEALYDEVGSAVVDVMMAHPEVCEPGNCPRGDFAGCITRYTFHDIMDIAFNDDGDILGGMDGCIDFTNADNNGLYGCMVGHEPLALVVAYRKVCARVSLADFGVIAAEAIMAKTATDPAATEAAFKQNFMWGRRTEQTCTHVGVRHLLDPEDSCEGVETVFEGGVYFGHSFELKGVRSVICHGQHCDAAPHAPEGDGDLHYHGMNKVWYLTAALSGLHTLGRAEPKNEGYDGSWVSPGEETLKFNNGYFKTMINSAWVPDRRLRQPE
jgi:hypothetical protein